MGFRKDVVLSLVGKDFSHETEETLTKVFQDHLENGMHGLCFSAYEDDQEPGVELTDAQIKRRMEIIKPHTQWVRSFSCTEGNEKIPLVAKEYGLKTLVGAWLGKNPDINELELANAIELAKSGAADIMAIGNEVLYRKDLTEDELLNFMYRFKAEVPDVPVGYVDAYYEFENCPRVTDACDVILANCYPFWEGCALEYSLLYMKDMYNRAKRAAGDKEVIITETGWPSFGEKFHGAQPSHANAMKYFINTQNWSASEDIPVFYFTSFDEGWKTSQEGDVGAYWGIWDSKEQHKFF